MKVATMSDYGLEILDGNTCAELLASASVGRVAICGERPTILPVLYSLLDGDVVFRTAPGAKLIAAALNERVAFEVDHVDSAHHGGWSVDVVGTAEEIVHPRELARARALNLPCWAGEVRDRYVRIRTEEVTGRRISVALA
jgi:nitroimidazol reductase NimA-like FMN-containing flavoprotein (pyridoxamine 5'-phosphate oxidase superfamily)